METNESVKRFLKPKKYYFLGVRIIAPRKIIPQIGLEFVLRLGLELGFGRGGGQFSYGAIVLEPSIF